MTAKLPVIGSTAATTAFVSARLDGPDGRSLFFDGNSKITAGNGSFSEPAANAFSLVNVEDCPGSTEICRAACYVENLAAAQPDLFSLYRSNSTTIREILDDRKPPGPNVHRGGRRPDEWAWLVAEWIHQNAAGGFRWHVSGDVFSLAYARWIRKVVERSPQVRHWIYTRSFTVADRPVPAASLGYVRFGSIVDPLFGLENLEVNLSADADNYRQAKVFAERVEVMHGKRPRLCYMTVDGALPPDLEHGAVIFPDYSLRNSRANPLTPAVTWFDTLTPRHKQMVCPVDVGGKSERRRCGPCDRCLR